MKNPRIAVVTGASSGIGAEYARQLARRGWALVLVARRAERLHELAAELQQQHGIAAQAWPADLVQPAEVAQLADALRGRSDVALLINNAGFDTNVAFAQADLTRDLAMVELHVNTSMRLTHAVLPQMLAARHGAIINVASLAALVPAPGHAAYCATKAALVAFSETLQLELRGTGVHVQAFCPGLTQSEFHDTAAFADFDRAAFPAPLWMCADAAVAESLRCLERGRVVCVPGHANRVLATLGRLGLAPLLWRALVARPRWR